MSSSSCDSKMYTRILQNLLWQNIPRGERKLIFFMNLLSVLPGFMFFVSAVYHDPIENEIEPTVRVLGRQTKLSVAILLLTLVLIPIVNFTTQARLSKFRFALRLSQTTLFCVWVNAIFYVLSMNEYVKYEIRKSFENQNEGIAYLVGLLVAVILIFTLINPEYDTSLDLSTEIRECKQTIHADVRALSKSTD